MKKRIATAALMAAALGAVAAAPAQKSTARPAAAQAPAAGVEAQLQTYALHFLSWDPESRVTVTKSAERLPGMQGYKIVRKGRYEKLNVDRTYYVSDDGKWFFEGDSVANPAPKPIRSAADLTWVGEKFSGLFRTKVTPQLAPERDAPPYKGVNVAIETGYGPVRMPGYVSADGTKFLQGVFWDFRMDPREERRRHIDLSLGRAGGRPEAAVSIVEFADMECGYCKMRGLQMDKLLEANNGIVNARRHYKFFPLWFGHIWAMKAASAGDCIFKSAGAPAFFRFKEQVYARQESMTVSGIDEIGVTTAGAEGISSADFLACYLQEGSFSRVRHEIEEGYRLGVNSTPTYFIDGTEITWIEDKVMEDFLRTLAPKLKSIFGK
ncbi:MAG: DsbA family protein [Acidobacteriota bacterium]|nr:DsbA family protein [Acidobacteriota bacterium]